MAAVRLNVPGHHSQRGFSLLEVLVAFVIMSFSLAALSHAIGGSVRGFAAAEQSVKAALIADSLFARHDTVPATGLRETGTADQFTWYLTSEPIVVEVESPLWTLHRVTVELAWEERGEVRSLAMWSLRPELEAP